MNGVDRTRSDFFKLLLSSSAISGLQTLVNQVVAAIFIPGLELG